MLYRLRLPLVVLLGLGAGCGAGGEAPWVWPQAAPGEVGMDAVVLDGARAYAFAPDKRTQGVVVVRGGAIVAEWYEPGAGPDSYAASWSVAKSVTSALIGIAIERGEIAGVQHRLSDTYQTWRETDHAAMELEHVLRMTSGLAWEESYDIADADTSDVIKIVLSTGSPLAYVLQRPLAADPGTQFTYSSGDTLLLSGVIARATGLSAGDYARQVLFDPLGIDDADWWRSKTGETLTYCCIDMSSRDFARFGQLYLQRGQWDGAQVVPSAWVDASLSPSPANPGYGYQWWLIGRDEPGIPADTVAALGHDGQFVYVVPSLDLVVVRNGHYDKYPGEPVADPTLFLRYPSGGLSPGAGTVAPDAWSHAAFLGPIVASIEA